MIASAKRARSQITTLGATRYGIKRARGATPLTYCALLRGPSSLKIILDVPVPCPGFPMKPALKIEPQCRVQIVGCVSVVLPEVPTELRQQPQFCRIIRPILDMLRIAGIRVAD